MKQQKRDENELDREMRKQAKAFFREKTKKDPAAFRQKITDIKKILLKLHDKPLKDEKTRMHQALEDIVSAVAAHKPRC